MLTRTIRTAFFAGATLCAPAIAHAGPDRAPAVHTVAAKQLPTAASAQDASQYADREATEKDAAQFQGGLIESSGGGTVVVISGAALVAFILLALIIM